MGKVISSKAAVLVVLATLLGVVLTTVYDVSNVSATNTQTPVTPPVSPSPTPNTFVFPSCQNTLPTPGDKAHYVFGIHQIVGGPLLWGSDDVYTLADGNYLQCFCPVTGNTGIQTNWLRSLTPIQGWFFENGAQWNLGNYTYAAQNVDFSCNPEDPTPTPTSDPNDICPNVEGVQTQLEDGWYQLDPPGRECRQFQYGGPESAHRDNPGSPVIEGYGIGGGQVLGASTMASAGTFAENLSLAIMVLGATFTYLGVKHR